MPAVRSAAVRASAAGPAVVLAALGGALALAAGLAGCGGKADAARGRDLAVPVRIALAQSLELPTTVEALGTVVPRESVAVRARVDGQLVRVVVREGADVKRGELLFEIDPRPFAARHRLAQATLARDLALLAKAQDQLRRYDDLIAKGYVSANLYASAKADVEAAAATVEADRAAAASAQLDLEFAALRAPIAGRVGRVLVQQGNLVRANADVPLLTINRLDPVYVDFAVPERTLAGVRAALSAGHVQVEVQANGSAAAPIRRSGELTFLDNQVDAATGTLRLRATLANADRALWPGQYARVRVAVPAQGAAIVVPAGSVGQSADGSYVFVVGADQHAEQRVVDVVRTEGSYAVIGRGLAAGERVIVDGQSRVAPGGLVKDVGDAGAPAAAPGAAPAAAPAAAPGAAP